MYETQDNIPVRDWVTLGIILLMLIVVISLGFYFAEQTATSSSTVVSGHLVTAPADSAQAENGQNDAQTSAQGASNGEITTAQGEPEVRQVSFFQVFGLLLVGSAVFAVLISVLIASLIVVGSRIFQKKS